MGRIPTLEPDQVSGPVREIYETYQKERGNVPNAFKTLAHRPDYLRSIIEHYRAVMFTGSLSFELKELVFVKVSKVNASRY